MEMTRRLLCAALAAAALQLGAPRGASGQEALWERVRAVFDGPAVARIERAVEAAAPRGVPAQPILEKALEGAEKGVPPARVLPVVEEYAGRLGRAAGLLPPAASRAGLVAAADALRRGVPPETVGEMARVHADAAPAALVVLGDLIEAGVPADQARDAVRETHARGRSADELLDLPAMVRRRIREGHDPSEAARGAAEMMGRGGPPAGMVPGSMGGARGKPPVPPGSRGQRGGSRGGGRGGGGGGGAGGGGAGGGGGL